MSAGWHNGHIGLGDQRKGRRKSAPFWELAAGAAYAKEQGVEARTFDSLTLAAQLAWSWRVFNELAVLAIRETPNTRVVIYEDLCRQSTTEARAVFAFVGLDWNSLTENFLSASTQQDDSKGYFDVFRVTATGAHRWRETLPPHDQEAILAVVRDSPVAQ